MLCLNNPAPLAIKVLKYNPPREDKLALDQFDELRNRNDNQALVVITQNAQKQNGSFNCSAGDSNECIGSGIVELNRGNRGFSFLGSLPSSTIYLDPMFFLYQMVVKPAGMNLHTRTNSSRVKPFEGTLTRCPTQTCS